LKKLTAIGAPRGLPASGPRAGRSPWVMARLISASLQAPMPVSRSGVMFEATPAYGGMSKPTPPPASSRPGIARPSASLGVWQLPHARIVVTR
jgi:hypothetical protein